jgi:hypothetical protein
VDDSGVEVPVNAAEGDHELAVVILSHGDYGDVIGAVASLRSQAEQAELVVSHSGGGKAPGVLAERFPDVALTVSDRLRLPGAARNAGVTATRAPFVAFLAADCRADPGWVSGRMTRHRAGAVAVGSAIAPLNESLPALASHVLQHSGRTAYIEAPPGLRFGASYSRETLAAHGPFPEDLDYAEDTAFNRRLLTAGIVIEPAPEVVTRHAYPPSTVALCRDQYRRARRRAAVRGHRGWRASLLARAVTIAPIGFWRVARPGSEVPRGRLAAALPLVVLGALCGAAGSLRGAPPNPAAESEREFHAWLRACRSSPSSS